MKIPFNSLRPSQINVEVLFLLLWPVLSVSAADASSTALIADVDAEFIQHVWTVEQGLPHNTIEAVVQTCDGYLWVATLAGLARFDGIKFTVFNRRNTPEMVNDECHALAEDVEGSLWIGTFDGLLRYRNQSFTRFTTRDGLSMNEVRALCASRQGGVWIGKPSGLQLFRSGKIKRFTSENGLESRRYNL